MHLFSSSLVSRLLNARFLTQRCARPLAGTYLGDYFGILMSHRVTSFPFNIMENPMYNGSTLCFLGTALWYARPAGVVISAIVFVVYLVALEFEG
jgi:phosphatidylethanolamine N-methyltransferase